VMLKRMIIALACIGVLYGGTLALSPALAAQLAVPAAPQNVHSSVANGAVTVQWDAVSGAASYDLYRGLSSNGETVYASGIVSNFFVNTKVSAGITYYYEVTAVNGSGQSPRSAETQAVLSTGATTTTTPRATPTKASSAPGLGQVVLIAFLLLVAIGGLVFVARFVLRRRPGRIDASATGPLSARLADSPYADEWMAPPPPESRPLAMPPSSQRSRPRLEDTDPDRSYGPPDPAPGWGLTHEMPALGAPFAGVPSVYGDEDVPIYRDEDATVFAGDDGPEERFPRRSRDSSGWIPAWPVEETASSGGENNGSRRTMWLIIGGFGTMGVAVLVVLAVVAGNVLGNAIGSSSTLVTGHQPTVTPIPPTATVVPTATTPPQQVLAAVSCGGPAAGVYIADPKGGSAFGNGSTYQTSQPIDIGQVTDPAPQSVYQHERWGNNFSYTFHNLPSANAITVRLDFAELFFTQPGKRLFNVSINNQQVLSNFDIVAAAGGPLTAISRSFTVQPADGNTVVIAFHNGDADHAQCDGIELLTANQ
jgi:hypothetical protein